MTRCLIAICAPAGMLALLVVSVRSGIVAPDREQALRAAGLNSLPPMMLWAWERREDLTFIDPDTVGVAVLAGTVFIRGDSVAVRPRFQPLIVPHGTRLVAVVRIQASHSRPPSLSALQRTQTLQAIEHLARGNIEALQIDFDATNSQRMFYRALLFDLRRALPASLPLSITAIASWCIYDAWLKTLPIDEAVPMLFRMGPDSARVREYLAVGGDFPTAPARRSLGIACDEAPVRIPANRRVYIFSPRAWSRGQEAAALERLKAWGQSFAR